MVKKNVSLENIRMCLGKVQRVRLFLRSAKRVNPFYSHLTEKFK